MEGREGLKRPSWEEIVEARARIKPYVTNFPLVQLNYSSETMGHVQVYLKPENLQRIQSFKIRPAVNSILSVLQQRPETKHIITASAGNMGQGLAYFCQKQNLACTVVVPDHAPEMKLEALRRYGATIVKISFSDWWQIISTHNVSQFCPDLIGEFIHPVCSQTVLSGNATIGAEILEELPDVDVILIPYGGGALASGIASAVKNKETNKTKVYAVEVSTAAPLVESLKHKKPMTIEYTTSFVDGIGGKEVLPQMWNIVEQVIDGSIVSTPEECAEGIRIVAERNKLIIEGAAGASVAAALKFAQTEHFKTSHSHHDETHPLKIVCILSGGGLDTSKLIKILSNEPL